MSGYTPAFESIYTGSLHGQWPTAAVWASLLPLIDSRGRIDMSFQAIATMTGWPIDLLRQGIAKLEEPDADSRSPAEEGRRLVKIDPARSWGWRVVNHGLYKERAREKQRSSDGRNADKVREWRNRQNPDVTRSNPDSPDVTSRTLSDSDSDSDTNQKEAATPQVVGLDMQAWKRWETYRRSINKPIKSASMLAAQRKLAGFGADQSAVVENSIAEGYTGLFPAKQSSPQRRIETPVHRHREFGQ